MWLTLRPRHGRILNWQPAQAPAPRWPGPARPAHVAPLSRGGAQDGPLARRRPPVDRLKRQRHLRGRFGALRDAGLLWRVPRLPGRLAAAELIEVGQGRDRTAYRLRDRPEWLAKVARPGVDGVRLIWWEHRVARHAEAAGLPIPRVRGLIATEHGPAQVVDAVLDSNAGLGPTLAQLAQEARIGQTECAALNRFAAALLDTGLPFYELRPSNLVLGRRGGVGPAAFWLVDGFGERQVLPLRRLLPARRRAYALARLPKLTRKIPALRWDGAATRFRVTEGAGGRRVARDGTGS